MQSDMSEVCDVAVVGAGPVGLLTALGLAQAGRSVTVIDAEPGINDSPRAAVYFPTTLKILDRLGLLEDTLAISFLSKSFAFHLLASGEVARIADTFPPDSPYPYNAHFGQHLLAQLVLKHFNALSRTTMRWSTRLVGLTQPGQCEGEVRRQTQGVRMIRAEHMSRPVEGVPAQAACGVMLAEPCHR